MNIVIKYSVILTFLLVSIDTEASGIWFRTSLSQSGESFRCLLKFPIFQYCPLAAIDDSKEQEMHFKNTFPKLQDDIAFAK